MSPLERMLAECRKPFDIRRSNCAHAVGAALAHSPAYQRALALHRPSSDVLKSARDAAAKAKCAPASASGDAWGVCDSRDGRAMCVRIAGHWWRRGATGIVSVTPAAVIESWNA